MVWLFSRNFRPSLFLATARTGIRVKTRELRRAVLFCGSLMVLCYRASGQTSSQPCALGKFPKTQSAKSLLKSHKVP
jgi:hypothetical protein